MMKILAWVGFLVFFFGFLGPWMVSSDDSIFVLMYFLGLGVLIIYVANKFQENRQWIIEKIKEMKENV